MPRKKERPTRFVRAIPLRDVELPSEIVIGGVAPEAEPPSALMMEVIGRVLGLLRKRFRIRQVEMAERLDWPQSVISRIENGEINVTVDQLYAWTNVLDLEAERIGHDDLAVTPSVVLDIVDGLTGALIRADCRVSWETLRLAEPDNGRLTGRALENFAVDYWPRKHRRLV